MRIKSIRQAKNLSGKTVLLRVDFNVPLSKGKVLDDLRIVQSIPDIAFLLDKNCKIIIATHLGRPEGKVKPEYSTKPVAVFLGKLLKRPIKFLDITGLKKIVAAREIIKKMKPGSLIFLENLRFNKGEQLNDQKFARGLASLADIYVNDAFAVCHRADASVAAIKKYLPSFAGLLLEKEISNLRKIIKPKKPLVVVVGGEKMATKISLLKNLLPRAKYILIGGALANVFLLAKRINIGKSLVDRGSVALARKILRRGRGKIILPIDLVTATSLKNHQKIGPKNLIKIRKYNEVQAKEFIGDIGPETIALFANYLKQAKTIVWNGPLGLFEVPNFRHGTVIVGRTIASVSGDRAFGVVGGGETVEAVKMSQMGEYIDWVSTGGGAMLAFLGKEPMPGLKGIVR